MRNSCELGLKSREYFSHCDVTGRSVHIDPYYCAECGVVGGVCEVDCVPTIATAAHYRRFDTLQRAASASSREQTCAAQADICQLRRMLLDIVDFVAGSASSFSLVLMR
jgi:hypothetical protein